jgi:hypothetical protein
MIDDMMMKSAAVWRGDYSLYLSSVGSTPR